MRSRILALIDNLEISQTAFATAIGVSKGNISDLIKGRTKNLSVEALTAIHKVYNVNPTWLLTGEGGMFLTSPQPSPKERELRDEGNGELSKDEREIIAFLRENPKHKKVINWLLENSQESKNEAIRYILDFKNG